MFSKSFSWICTGKLNIGNTTTRLLHNIQRLSSVRVFQPHHPSPQNSYHLFFTLFKPPAIRIIFRNVHESRYKLPLFPIALRSDMIHKFDNQFTLDIAAPTLWKVVNPLVHMLHAALFCMTAMVSAPAQFFSNRGQHENWVIKFFALDWTQFHYLHQNKPLELVVSLMNPVQNLISYIRTYASI